MYLTLLFFSKIDLVFDGVFSEIVTISSFIKDNFENLGKS